MSGSETEIELKIKLSPADIEKVFAVFAPHGAKIVEKARVYYDTPELDLYKGGFSLRLEPGGKAQTFKMENGAAGEALSRLECVDAAEGAPRLEAVSDAAARGRIAPLLGKALVPIFTAAITRRVVDLGTVELAFDTGALVLADGRARQDFHEIEIELKSGPASGIDSVREKIFALAPSAQVQPLSKAAQGARLWMR